MNIKNKKRHKVFYWTYFTLFFAGLLAITGGMLLFENTILIWKVPVIIFLLTGFLMTPVTSFSFEKYCKIESIFWKIFFNIVSFGGLLVGLLIAINYYFPDNVQQSHKTEILETGYLKSRGRRNVPYAEVKIDGTIKRLVFPKNVELAPYKFVVVDTKKGLLGFPIITHKMPVTE